MKYYKPDDDKLSHYKSDGSKACHYKHSGDDTEEFEEDMDARTIEDIIADVADICISQIMFNTDSAGICQKINMQGFKRLHRHLSKKFHCYYLEFLNNSINDYNIIPESHSEFRPYTVSSFKDHLYNRLHILESHIKIMGELSKEFFNITGVIRCDMMAIQKCLYRSLCKTNRAIQRFEDNKWMPHDIYVYDTKLHKKMKKIESEEGYHKE